MRTYFPNDDGHRLSPAQLDAYYERQATVNAPLIRGERTSEGHSGMSGLAKHSVGELYPWTIKVIGRRCVPFHTITGEHGQPFWFISTADDDKTFEGAHALAEKWIRDHKDCHVRKN